MDVSWATLLAFHRSLCNDGAPDAEIIVVLNLTPVPRQNYHIGASRPGRWREILNSDSRTYCGSGWGNLGEVQSVPVPFHGRLFFIHLNVPPLGAIFLKPDPRSAQE